MRIYVDVEETMASRAAELTGIANKPTPVEMGLKAPIAKESARRMAELGGSNPDVEAIARRRQKPNP